MKPAKTARPVPPPFVRRTATLFVKCIAFAGSAALLLQRDQAFNHWGRPKRSPSKVSLCTFRCLPSETPNISPAEWEAAKAAEQRRAGLEHNRAQTKGDSWGGGVSFLDSGPLECGRYDADDCKAAYRSGKYRGTLSNFYARCRSEHGSQPLRSRCTLCCTGENARWAVVSPSPPPPPRPQPPPPPFTFCSQHAVKASADSNFGTRGTGRRERERERDVHRVVKPSPPCDQAASGTCAWRRAPRPFPAAAARASRAPGRPGTRTCRRTSCA